MKLNTLMCAAALAASTALAGCATMSDLMPGNSAGRTMNTNIVLANALGWSTNDLEIVRREGGMASYNPVFHVRNRATGEERVCTGTAGGAFNPTLFNANCAS